jgi:hypothetical protein
VTNKKKAAIIKTEKPGASAKENIVPSAAVKKEKQSKPHAPIKRKAAPASNNKTNVTKKAKKLTECCHQETCEYRYQVLATKEAMVKKYGYAAMETYHPQHGRKCNHFHSIFSNIAGTPS